MDAKQTLAELQAKYEAMPWCGCDRCDSCARMGVLAMAIAHMTSVVRQEAKKRPACECGEVMACCDECSVLLCSDCDDNRRDDAGFWCEPCASRLSLQCARLTQ